MVTILAVLMSATGYAGYSVYTRNGLPSRVPTIVLGLGGREAKSVRLMSRYLNLHYDSGAGARVTKCWLSEKQEPSEYVPECVAEQEAGASARPLVLVWGDSHAARLFAGMKSVLGSRLRTAQFTRNICPPVLDLGYETCVRSNAFVMDRIRAIRPDAVILFAVWNHYGTWGDGTENSKKLLRTVSALKQAGVATVIVVGPVPQWTIDLPRNLFNIYQRDGLHRVPARTKEGLNPWVPPVDSALAKDFQFTGRGGLRVRGPAILQRRRLPDARK